MYVNTLFLCSGGFFNSLTKNGQVYDTVKYGWLQGRQVWTLCRLYYDVNRFKTSDILAAAKHGKCETLLILEDLILRISVYPCLCIIILFSV